MSRIVAVLSLLIALALPGFAVGAPCKYYDNIPSAYPDAREVPGPFRLNVEFGDIARIDPNIPVGGVLKKITLSLADLVDADGQPQPYGAIYCLPDMIGGQTFSNDVGPATAIPKVYASGIPGIGVRIWVFDPSCCTFPHHNPATGGGAQLGSNRWGLDLIKTGPIGAGGTIAGQIASDTIDRENQVFYVMGLKTPIIVVPNTPTCDVSTPDVRVALDADDVSSYTSVSMARGDKDFKVSLACSGGDPGTSIPVYLSLADQTLPTNTTQALTLTSASTASGVGIQILRNGTPISLDPALNKFKVQTVLPGNTSIDVPFKARYIRTGNMTAGSVEAIATFTMEYQ